MTTIEKFELELRVRRYSANTIKTYSSCLQMIISKIGEQPTEEQIKQLLLNVKSVSYHKQIAGTILKYYQYVLKKKVDFSSIPFPRKEYKLPEVFSQEEVKKLFSVINNKKHLAICSLLYGCGMRIGEVLNLKIESINGSRKIIHIKQAKGNKDRIVPIPENLLELLRQYYTEYKPKTLLFNGQFGVKYSETSINNFLKYYAGKANIKKHITAHKLRHSYATHLLEHGTGIRVIQELLGHKSSKTTEIYTHVTSHLLENTYSPIESISINK